MARKRKSYGSASAVHTKTAARNASQARFEEKIILQHLREGQCRPAINGLVHLGEAVGKMSAHKASQSKKRGGRGLKMGTVHVRARRLAEKVSAQCLR